MQNTEQGRQKIIALLKLIIMKKMFSCMAVTILLFACKKDLQETIQQNQLQQETQSAEKPPSPPPSNANPVFALRNSYQVNPNRSVPAIYVMDVNGANMTKVYTNYTSQTFQTPDFPAWSSDGTKLCFTLNWTDLYTLNVSVVNGVPVGSSPVKIGDGVAGGGAYAQGKWRPGQNQIACVWKRTGDPDKIHMLPSTGGAPAVLYSAASTDWFIELDLAFKADGSNLVFSERQISTGYVFLKVLDVATSQVIKSIELSQYKSIREMDWAKSAGSNIVAITTIPHCDNTTVGMNGIHQLQTIDVSSAAPSLTWLRNDVGNISFSPNDTQITVSGTLGRVCNPTTSCCFSSYSQVRVFTIASNTVSGVFTGGTMINPDWKR